MLTAEGRPRGEVAGKATVGFCKRVDVGAQKALIAPLHFGANAARALMLDGFLLRRPASGASGRRLIVQFSIEGTLDPFPILLPIDPTGRRATKLFTALPPS
jgi:hypothetical protein